MNQTPTRDVARGGRAGQNRFVWMHEPGLRTSRGHADCNRQEIVRATETRIERQPVKALTIAQPYAHLICLPDDHPRAKRVENRRWPTSYRGPLLIHAGKSREWLDLDDEETTDEEYGIPLAEMSFGAIVGAARLSDCVKLLHNHEEGCVYGIGAGGSSRVIPSKAADQKWPWLKFHEHTEGPYCFVLTECRRFETPIPYRGAQGLFEVPDEVVKEQMEKARV